MKNLYTIINDSRLKHEFKIVLLQESNDYFNLRLILFLNSLTCKNYNKNRPVFKNYLTLDMNCLIDLTIDFLDNFQGNDFYNYCSEFLPFETELARFEIKEDRNFIKLVDLIFKINEKDNTNYITFLTIPLEFLIGLLHLREKSKNKELFSDFIEDLYNSLQHINCYLVFCIGGVGMGAFKMSKIRFTKTSNLATFIPLHCYNFLNNCLNLPKEFIVDRNEMRYSTSIEIFLKLNNPVESAYFFYTMHRLKITSNSILALLQARQKHQLKLDLKDIEDFYGSYNNEMASQWNIELFIL